MSVFASLIEGVDSAFSWLGGQMKQTFADYCDLESAEDDFTLVAKDGSLLSVIRVDGVRTLVGGRNFFSNVVEPLDTTLSQPFSGKNHMVQVLFSQDPDRTEREIKRMIEPAVETMNRLGMDMEDMLDERVTNLAKWTNFEACYIVLWTRPMGLGKSDLKYEQNKKMEVLRGVRAPIDRGQNPLAAISVLYDRHRSFVDGIVGDCSKIGVAVEMLDSHRACREIRNTLDPDFTADDWEPLLPGDKSLPQKRKGFIESEEWDVLWPKLSWQLTPRDAKIVGDNVVEIGNRIYAPVYMDLFPRDPTPFWDLFGRMVQRNLPWRASFLLEGDGLSSLSTKKLMAQVLAFTSGDNKLISGGIEALQNSKMHEAATIVKIRASFCTWAPKGDMELLTKRQSDMARAIESWGAGIVSEITGDPVEGVASSALGFTYNNIGTSTAAPLKDILMMMPLVRPSSPWESGAVIFRSPDGKLLPYQPGSSKQTTWISLVFAKPGSGKSVLMNMTNLALCLSPGIKRLPRIAIIDIGPSSSGLISLLKEALPEDKKHLAAYHRLRMTREYSINPFDTQLGCRFPTALERQFLINFLTLLVTDVNESKPFTGMAGLVTAVIDEMYKKASDKEQPHAYSPGIDHEVDDLVKKFGFHTDKKTTWWEICDKLFEKGCHHEASLAQRQAVPVLAEAALSAQDEKIKNTYGKVVIQDTQEDLITAFNRMVADALQYYPILARPTAFDIGESRVVSLDLDEVAKTGGPVADRQTAVMYMMARFVMAKDFYITEGSLGEMPYPGHLECPPNVPANAYRDHHRTRIEAIREDLKRICYDEFHRTSKAQTVRDQVLIDMREGRKWAVDVTLASQALEDFDVTMMEFATGIFVMDGGNAQTVAKIANVFGFQDPAEQAAMQYSVHGPKKGGGTFLAKFSTTAGWYTMLLTSTLGPIELWAFSTTAEDVAVRNKLYGLVGPKLARKLLAVKYPNGSAKSDIDARKEKLRSSGASVDSDGSNIIGTILEELLVVKANLEAKGKL